MAVNHPQNHSYREVLVQKTASLETYEPNGGGEAPHTSGIASSQWKGEGGRLGLGLAKAHGTLVDVKQQLSALQDKVDLLIQCVKEDNNMVLGFVRGFGNLAYRAPLKQLGRQRRLGK